MGSEHSVVELWEERSGSCAVSLDFRKFTLLCLKKFSFRISQCDWRYWMHPHSQWSCLILPLLGRNTASRLQLSFYIWTCLNCVHIILLQLLQSFFKLFLGKSPPGNKHLHSTTCHWNIFILHIYLLCNFSCVFPSVMQSLFCRNMCSNSQCDSNKSSSLRSTRRDVTKGSQTELHTQRN